MTIDLELQIFTANLAKEIIPEVKRIITTYQNNPNKGKRAYIEFIRKVKEPLERIIKALPDPRQVGVISPRLLRDPLSVGILDDRMSSDEEKAHIMGYIKAILQLIYCRAKGLEVWQFEETSLYKKTFKTQYRSNLSAIIPLIHLMDEEIEDIRFTADTQIFKENILTTQDNEMTLKEYNEREIDTESEEEERAVPFTARLMAYYRVQELSQKKPLIFDPFAKRLTGDLESYANRHRFIAGGGAYPLVRSYYVEKNLLTSWCESNRVSQIVLLGAGLDTRVYRFKPLQSNTHTIFELDFASIIQYKQEILQDEQPYCDLIRISANLTNTDWSSQLLRHGFLVTKPTFWVLEGLVYYMPRDSVIELLTQGSKLSPMTSQIFADVCRPALSELKFGPFTRYFKWGLDLEYVPSFFGATGWNVTCSYADNHDQGRDIGRKGMIFVQGKKRMS